MFSKRTNATQFFVFQAMCICSTSSSKAVSVNLFVQLLIQLSSSSPSLFARVLSQQASSVLMTFPNVLSKAISLYALRSAQSSLLGFQRTIVQAALNLLRQQLALITIVIRACSALISSSLIALRNWFEISSSPRHLFSLTFCTMLCTSFIVTSQLIFRQPSVLCQNSVFITS